jgi:hypothetical protein
MKASAIALAVILASFVPAHAVTTNQQVSNYFTDANGNVGLVFVDRQTDPTTNVTTTTLSYSFCIQTTEATCLEGNGVIPNGAFTGTLHGDPLRAEIVKVLADTTIPGFMNELCIGPDPFGGCAQISPATGGLITLTYVTKRGNIEIFTSNDYKLENFKVTLNSTNQTSQGPASAQGTVLGTTVSKTTAAWGFDTVSGKGSLGSKAQKSQSQLTLEKSLTPQALRRLQRLRGEKINQNNQ